MSCKHFPVIRAPTCAPAQTHVHFHFTLRASHPLVLLLPLPSTALGLALSKPACVYICSILHFLTAARRARVAKPLPSLRRLAASACFGRGRPPLKPPELWRHRHKDGSVHSRCPCDCGLMLLDAFYLRTSKTIKTAYNFRCCLITGKRDAQ